MLIVADYFREVIPRVYMPVLHDLLTDDELATLKLSIRASDDETWLDDAVELSTDAVIGTDEESLAIEVDGELQNFWLAPSMTNDENRERYYSNMQDWISETTLGWGSPGVICDQRLGFAVVRSDSQNRSVRKPLGGLKESLQQGVLVASRVAVPGLGQG